MSLLGRIGNWLFDPLPDWTSPFPAADLEPQPQPRGADGRFEPVAASGRDELAATLIEAASAVEGLGSRVAAIEARAEPAEMPQMIGALRGEGGVRWPAMPQPGAADAGTIDLLLAGNDAAFLDRACRTALESVRR